MLQTTHISLAPMEGVTDAFMRQLLCASGQLDRCVTEFLRVTNSLLPKRVFYKHMPELLHHSRSGATPVYLQLLGSDGEALAANAARAAALGAAGIDLNFGCPAKTVNRHRGGAVLLQFPEQLAQITAAVRRAVPSQVPVTAKMRLGYLDKNLYLENAIALAEAGAAEICVHARTKLEGYKPPAHWDYIAAITEQVTVPVVANGEIWTVADAQACMLRANTRRLMLGRGLLADPLLAHQLRGQRGLPATWAEVAALLLQFQTLRADAYPDRFAGDRLKQWLVYLRPHYTQASVLFERCKRLRQPQDLLHELALECDRLAA